MLFRSVFRRNATVLYANPICSQLDQLVHKTGTTEDVLGLLVTHRGVFFVHNLVTAIDHLASVPRGEYSEIEVNALLRDYRYDVLLRDLIRFIPNLDFQSISTILAALKKLDHKYFPFFHNIMEPIAELPIPSVRALLQCTDAMVWAGYVHHLDFWKNAAHHFATAPMSRGELLHALRLFAELDKYYPDFYARAEKEVQSWDWNKAKGEEVAIVAKSFVKKGEHDAVFVKCMDHVATHASAYPLGGLIKCCRAFREQNLRSDAAVMAAVTELSRACQLSVHRKKRHHAFSLLEVTAMCEAVAHFGINVDLTHLFKYCEEFVDEAGENAAINLVFSLSALNKTGDFPYLLSLVFRKIGLGTAWEMQKRKVFSLWLCHLIQFPYLDINMPKRCVTEGLRSWLLHRRGYNVPFPDEVAKLSKYLTMMNIPHESCVEIDSPYTLDIVLPDRTAFIFTSEVTKNTGDACGLAWIQANHLRMWGYRMIPIPILTWRKVRDPEEYLRLTLTLPEPER